MWVGFYRSGIQSGFIHQSAECFFRLYVGDSMDCWSFYTNAFKGSGLISWIWFSKDWNGAQDMEWLVLIRIGSVFRIRFQRIGSRFFRNGILWIFEGYRCRYWQYKYATDYTPVKLVSANLQFVSISLPICLLSRSGTQQLCKKDFILYQCKGRTDDLCCIKTILEQNIVFSC